jgi:membrane-bound lytic murein transglycosylase D
MPSAPCNIHAATGTSLRSLLLCVLIALVLGGCQSQQLEPFDSSGKPTDPALGLQQPDDLSAEMQEQPDSDIWIRVTEGYQLQDQFQMNPRIDRQRLWYASRPAHIEKALQNGSPYLHHVVEQLDASNMPLEIVLLPVIESGYNPLAYSRSHASGLWQFIPSTGRNFNLRQTGWYDGRRDIHASTAAAVRYLNYLHQMFNDDWLLALAAYNAGEGTVSRAIQRNRKLGLPTDYWNLQLPRETQEYIPRLLAVAQIVQSPEAYGVKLPEVSDTPYFEVVRFDRRMQLSSVAEMANIDEDELFLLNPAFKKGVTLDGPAHLLVPVEKAEQFNANLALLADTPQSSWKEYRVRPGDSLHGIAVRHQLTVATLKDINQLQSNALRIGQVLSIPGGTSDTAVAMRYQPPAAAAAPVSHQVRKGDTLSGIAGKHKVQVSQLRKWNNLRSDNLKIGQTLQIKAPQTAQRSSTTIYKVRKGDSLYLIAKRFNVSVKQLQQWNPRAGKTIKPGQTLTLRI